MSEKDKKIDPKLLKQSQRKFSGDFGAAAEKKSDTSKEASKQKQEAR